MNKKSVFLALSGLLLALCGSASAQQPVGKVVRVGYLGNDRSPASAPREKAFLQGLRDHGGLKVRTL
jgi:hypothetical protein